MPRFRSGPSSNTRPRSEMPGGTHRPGHEGLNQRIDLTHEAVQRLYQEAWTWSTAEGKRAWP